MLAGELTRGVASHVLDDAHRLDDSYLHTFTGEEPGCHQPGYTAPDDGHIHAQLIGERFIARDGSRVEPDGDELPPPAAFCLRVQFEADASESDSRSQSICT